MPGLHQNYLQILCAFALLQYLFQLNLLPQTPKTISSIPLPPWAKSH